MSQRKAFDWRFWAKQVENTEVGTIDRKIDWPETKDGRSKEVIEKIIHEVETKRTDLTSSYQDWIIVGFALADEFGVSGRSYFHRLSQFHPDYSIENCDDQFTKCLNSKRAGVTIGSLFYMAQEAGIIIKAGSNSIDQRFNSNGLETASSRKIETSGKSTHIFNTPRFPVEIYDHLPILLQQSSAMFEKDFEKDVFLVGSLGVISACLPNVYGKYFEERHTPHLFVFITAPAGSGKGKLKWSKFFGQAIHEHKRSEYEKQKIFYEQDLANYEAMDKKKRATIEKPFEPANQMFFIPANSSSSAMIQAIKDNKLQGIVFETEADTLAGTLKQEWGNFSDLLRKAFHHENTSLFRRKDNEYIELNDPHLALVLSGTPKQVHSLTPDVENGLFSRFLFYAFEDDSPFQNPFKSDKPFNYEDFFKDKGQYIFSIYENLLNQPNPIDFRFTEEQGRIFTEEFNKLFQRNKQLFGDEFNANSRRLGLITFRIAMILSTLRCYEDDIPASTIICSDLDFNTSMQLAITLEQHTIAVYRYLPSTKLQGIKEKFYGLLPDKFNRQDYLSVAQTLEIKEKAAEKYISHFKDNNLLHHDHNSYTKPE